MKNIVINATATKISGAFTILNGLIEFISKNEKIRSEYAFHLFTILDKFDKVQGINVYKFSEMKWTERIAWDNGGLKKFCKDSGIYPDLIISVQNTCTNFEGVPQLVYYHQTLPLIPYKWHFYKKEEYKMFLYAHFYKFFVRKYNKRAFYVVQLPSIKNAFFKKIKNVTESRIFVVRPDAPKIDVSKVLKKDIFIGKKLFLYPATSHPYKNHEIIINAIKLMSLEERNQLAVIFTVPEDSFVAKKIKEEGLENTIHCIGMLPQSELFSLYKRADGLLFPSKIESFGLPLDEAICFGMPIVASDLLYAREVLEGYSNSFFADSDKPEQWKDNLLEALKKEKIDFIREKRDSWEEIWKIAEDYIGE